MNWCAASSRRFEDRQTLEPSARQQGRDVSGTPGRPSSELAFEYRLPLDLCSRSREMRSAQVGTRTRPIASERSWIHRAERDNAIFLVPAPTFVASGANYPRKPTTLEDLGGVRPV